MKFLTTVITSVLFGSVLTVCPVAFADEFDDLRSSSANMTQEQANNVEAGCGPCVVPLLAAAGRAVAPQIARGIGQRIAANGHTYVKHVAQKASQYGEFSGIRTTQQLANRIEDTVSNATHTKFLSNGRSAYYHQPSNTFVISNPAARNGGSAYQPDKGLNYFNNFK